MRDRGIFPFSFLQVSNHRSALHLKVFFSKMMCGDEVACVVADIGSSQCKFGFAGQDAPHHVFRSETGRYSPFHSPLHFNTEEGNTKKEVILMDTELLRPSKLHEAVEVRGLLLSKNESGKEGHQPLDWNTVEALFAYGFARMRIEKDMQSYALMAAEAHFESLQDKEKVSSI